MESRNIPATEPATRAVEPLLSVVIRVRNEAASLRLVFQALRAQRCNFAWEVVMVDNESEDDTRTVCEQMGARVVSLPRAEFTYGRALNVGLREARGELALLLSAHALPIGSDFLQKVVEPFSDSKVAAARCLSIDDHNAIRSWFAPRVITYGSVDEQKDAEPERHWARLYPSASCAVIRKSVWQRIPFDETLESSEDKVWASQAIQVGYSAVYCAEAAYYYMRHYDGVELYRKRNRHYLGLYRHSGWVPMQWNSFAFLVIKSIVFAPLVGLRYCCHKIIEGWHLARIPSIARAKLTVGSLREFDYAKAPSKVETFLTRIRLVRGVVGDLTKRRVHYVGLPDNGNIGDKVLHSLAKRFLGVNYFINTPESRGRLLPVSVFAARGYYVIGGGSLLLNPHLLKTCETLRSAGGKPLLFGSGYCFPYDTSITQRWGAILREAPILGVRGPLTQKVLEGLGLKSTIIGDPGYLLNLDLAEPKAPGDYVVINVRSLPRVLGSLHEQDCQTRSLLNQLAAALALDGLRILFYSASADDHLVVQGWARELPYKADLRYYWGDFKEFAVITQRARAMITMRMHPGIFAAAFGVPVVAIDNRPKHSDSFQPMGDFVKLLDPVGLTIETLLDFARTAASENQERRRERFTLARQLALRQKAYCKTLAKKLGRVQRHEDPPLPFPDKFEQ